MSRLNGRRAQAEKQGLSVNVAILGAGRIARTMATTVTMMASDPRYANLVSPYAVAARDRNRAQDFAARYGLPVAYGSYEELLADPLVDLVYIATPHSLHAEQAIACLRAGKNVLVEKSFTANTSQAEELLEAANISGLLCAEAIWTRYMPSRTLIDDTLASGVIGEVRSITANLCYPVQHKARMVDPALAGGALLDVGVYPLNFIDMVVQGRIPTRIVTSMQPHSSGVDAQNSTTIYYDDDVMAVSVSSMSATSDRGGYVWGSEGYMVCHNINNVAAIDIHDADHKPIRHIDVPAQLTGYEYEVAQAANAILDGKRECAAMPHADTLRIMRLMDDIRERWGLRYPFE